MHDMRDPIVSSKRIGRPPLVARQIQAWSLMLVDNEPIIRAYQRDLDRVRAELGKIESELERFKGIDSKNFKQWLYTTFPVQLSRLRELQEESARLISRLNLMRQFQAYGVKEFGRAYARALRVETGEDPMPDFPPPPVADRSHPSPGSQEFFKEAMRVLAEDIGLDPGWVEDELESMVDEELSEDGTARPTAKEAQSIYRQIALRLHPDRGGAMTESEAQIWYRAQEAYQFGDVLTLRQLWLQITGKDQTTKQLTCAQMIAAIFETQAQTSALQMLRNNLKREPAWSFSRLTPKQLRSRRARVEKDIAAQEEIAREELEALRAECTRLARRQSRWEAKHKGSAEQLGLL